jgi:hypothetical protein
MSNLRNIHLTSHRNIPNTVPRTSTIRLCLKGSVTGYQKFDNWLAALETLRKRLSPSTGTFAYSHQLGENELFASKDQDPGLINEACRFVFSIYCFFGFYGYPSRLACLNHLLQSIPISGPNVKEQLTYPYI